MFDLRAIGELTSAQNAGNYIGASLLISLGLSVLTAVALWPVFTKAGLAGWSALIPVVSVYLLVKIAGLHGALTLLYVIPFVNIVISCVVAIGCGRAFGRSAAFSVLLLWLLSPLGYFIIGYGRSGFLGKIGNQTAQPV